MRIAVVQFPGSNADWDALYTAKHVLGADARYVFHKETSLGLVDAVIVPGGFAYGDYLRAGAIAAASPITPAIREHADRGGLVLGICNGFQVLTELKLLPGALTRNAHLRFECREVRVRVEASGPFTSAVEVGTILKLPIAHAEGRYQCSEETLRTLERDGRIAFRYVDENGDAKNAFPDNPNGSMANIAGIYNAKKNVLGLMPHPERASEPLLGSADGFSLFASLRDHVRGAL